MTVREYIEELDKVCNSLLDLCRIPTDSVHSNPCLGCALSKGDSKACPLGQLNDIQDALRYAIQYGICDIKADTDMDTAQVVRFMRRAVVNEYSVRTLRYCSPEYIEKFNLIPIEV